MDRTGFFEFKRRFQTHGLEGLKALPLVPKSYSKTTPPLLAIAQASRRQAARVRHALQEQTSE